MRSWSVWDANSGRWSCDTQATTSVLTQKEIDELGGSKSICAWEACFELAYQKCRGENVTLVGGVAPTAVRSSLK